MLPSLGRGNRTCIVSVVWALRSLVFSQVDITLPATAASCRAQTVQHSAAKRELRDVSKYSLLRTTFSWGSLLICALSWKLWWGWLTWNPSSRYQAPRARDSDQVLIPYTVIWKVTPSPHLSRTSQIAVLLSDFQWLLMVVSWVFVLSSGVVNWTTCNQPSSVFLISYHKSCPREEDSR